MDINVNVQVSGTVKVVLSSLLAQQELAGALTGAAQTTEIEQKAKPETKAAKKAAPAKKTEAAKEDKPEPLVEAEPATESAEGDALSEDELVAIRKKAVDFMHKDAANKDKVKNKLIELGAKDHRISGLSKTMLPDFEAFLQA